MTKRAQASLYKMESLRTATALTALALAAALSGCAAKPEAEVTPTVQVQVGGVASQAIQRKVVAAATLYPFDQAAIVPKVASPVRKFYVAKGSTVHAGELVVELESQDLVGGVTENRGGLAQAQAEYDSAVQKARQEEQLTKQVMDSAQKLYDNRLALYREGAVSAKDVDDASVALTQAKGEYETAVKQLDIKSAEGSLTAAKGKIASAEAQLSYSRIVSPISGVVTDRPFYPGEMPPAGAAVLTIMNLSQVVARAHVNPQDAALMKTGDAATISSGGPAIPGKVTLISPALDVNSTTVEIWVQAANPKGQLKPGANAQVTVVTQNVPNAIVAPAAALLTNEEGTIYVMVLDSDNNPHKQKVTVGIRDGASVQITQGLKAGQRVVTVGAFELFNEDDPVLAKTKIQVQAPKLPDEDEDEDQ